MKLIKLDFSPITGSTGNIEYLSLISFREDDEIIDENIIVEIINKAHGSLYS